MFWSSPLDEFCPNSKVVQDGFAGMILEVSFGKIKEISAIKADY